MKKLIVITCILCITVCGLFPKKELEKKKTEFCLFGGMTSTQLNFSLSPSSPAEESDSLSAGTLNTSIETLPTHSAASSFFVGGGVNIHISRVFCFQFSLGYKRKHSKPDIDATALTDGAQAVLSSEEEEPTEVILDHTLDYLSMTSLLKFRLSMGSAVIYPLIGFESQILLTGSESVLIDPISKFSPFDFHAVAGVGLRFNRFALEFRYGLGLWDLNYQKSDDVSLKSKGFDLVLLVYFDE